MCCSCSVLVWYCIPLYCDDMAVYCLVLFSYCRVWVCFGMSCFVLIECVIVLSCVVPVLYCIVLFMCCIVFALSLSCIVLSLLALPWFVLYVMSMSGVGIILCCPIKDLSCHAWHCLKFVLSRRVLYWLALSCYVLSSLVWSGFVLYRFVCITMSCSELFLSGRMCYRRVVSCFVLLLSRSVSHCLVIAYIVLFSHIISLRCIVVSLLVLYCLFWC